jgi:hypothetical protein
MNERDMEDLIASYPDDFFPDRGMKLKGRQQSFPGVGRFDLLFEDRFHMTILMELKAVAARAQDVDQLAKYRDQLIAQGRKHVFMWLVATHIPQSVRDFLDHLGVRYTEIHVGDYQGVADRHGIHVKSEIPRESKGFENDQDRIPARVSRAGSVGSEPRVPTASRVTTPSRLQWKAHGYDISLSNPEAFDSLLFTSLIDEFEQSVPSRRNSALVQDLRRWGVNPGSERWPHESNRSLLRWVTTNNYKAAVPHAHAIWKYLFGEPAPAWYVWSQGRGYEFDSQAWRVWSRA